MVGTPGLEMSTVEGRVTAPLTLGPSWGQTERGRGGKKKERDVVCDSGKAELIRDGI